MLHASCGGHSPSHRSREAMAADPQARYCRMAKLSVALHGACPSRPSPAELVCFPVIHHIVKAFLSVHILNKVTSWSRSGRYSARDRQSFQRRDGRSCRGRVSPYPCIPSRSSLHRTYIRFTHRPSAVSRGLSFRRNVLTQAHARQAQEGAAGRDLHEGQSRHRRKTQTCKDQKGAYPRA